jgi:hypothetical protein
MTPLFVIRLITFLIGCIGFRLFVTYLSYAANDWNLQVIGFVALYPVLYWFYVLFLVEPNTAWEKVSNMMWWKNLRPIHMMLWGLFAYLAISKNHMAYVVLLVDTAFGLLAFFVHHWMEGNLK